MAIAKKAEFEQILSEYEQVFKREQEAIEQLKKLEEQLYKRKKEGEPVVERNIAVEENKELGIDSRQTSSRGHESQTYVFSF